MIMVTALVVPFRVPVHLYLALCPRLALSGLNMNVNICLRQMCVCRADVTLRATFASRPHRPVSELLRQTAVADPAEPGLLVGL